MITNLHISIDKIFASEGGYCDVAGDSGGATKYGITQRTLAAWRGEPSTVHDVQQLTMGEASKILQAQYALPIQFDKLPAGLDYCLLDTATNSGPARAVKILQEVLGMAPRDVDGILGLHTLAAVTSEPPARLINLYSDARLKFLRGTRSWAQFGVGWSRRVAAVRAAALAMLLPTTDAI